jgi:hypothetical protein
LVDHRASEPTETIVANVLLTLETQLAVLDRVGATLAAAHLDSAIHALRLDQVARSLSQSLSQIPE